MFFCFQILLPVLFCSFAVPIVGASLIDDFALFQSQPASLTKLFSVDIVFRLVVPFFLDWYGPRVFLYYLLCCPSCPSFLLFPLVLGSTIIQQISQNSPLLIDSFLPFSSCSSLMFLGFSTVHLPPPFSFLHLGLKIWVPDGFPCLLEFVL